jgi:hypothetical protein
MIIAGNHPSSMVEQPDFRELVEFLHPGAKPMSRHRLRDLLEESYNQCQDDLLPGLGQETKVSIAVDCWKSPNDNHFLAVMCYYISDSWEYREALLGFEPLSGQHTGRNLAEVVEAVLARHDLTQRLLVVTSDNASNNDTMRSTLESSFSSQNVSWNANMMKCSCLAHVPNLASKSLLNDMHIAPIDGDDDDDDIDDDDSESLDERESALPEGTGPAATVAKV